MDFTPRSRRRIAKSVKWTERQAMPLAHKRLKRRGGGGSGGGSVAKTTTPIGAFTDATSTAGKGTIQPYALNTTTDVLETVGDTIEAFNLEDAIPADEWVYYDYDAAGIPWIEPLGDTPTATGAATYRATADALFTTTDGTVNATITAVISPGNANVSDTVTVNNVYKEAGHSGAQLLLLEVFDDPSYSYLTLNVEKQTTTVLTAIDWKEAGTDDIVISRQTVPVLDPTDLVPDQRVTTEDCP